MSEEIKSKREDSEALKNDRFKEFLKQNAELIERITPKNSTISKNDEWYNEDFWDEDYKNLGNDKV